MSLYVETDYVFCLRYLYYTHALTNVCSMKADTDYDGIGVGPNPEPTPGKCPSCNEKMNVSDRKNEGTDSIITSFVYECPNGCYKLLDKP